MVVSVQKYCVHIDDYMAFYVIWKLHMYKQSADFVFTAYYVSSVQQQNESVGIKCWNLKLVFCQGKQITV